MSQAADPTYLSIDRAMEFIGDINGVMSLLKTLQQTLSDDLPRLQDFLNKDDVNGANRPCDHKCGPCGKPWSDDCGCRRTFWICCTF
jgi:hypothetical protein